jgi:uncharacterized RDD family membrane protein YckC
MNWFYVDAGQQAGPVPDEQLDELVRNGKVRGDTLIWREGMANWQPYSQARPEGIQPPAPVAPPPPTAPGTIPPMAPAAGPITYQPAPATAYGIAYAGFWIRLVAKIIDYVIMRIVTLPLEFLPFGIMSTLPRDPSTWVNVLTPGLLLSAVMPVFFITVGLWVVYLGFFVGKFGASPGKMALGLKVVTENGTPVTYGRAFGRAFAEIISLFVCLIGYIMAAFDPQKRALHDHIAGTRVIKTRF